MELENCKMKCEDCSGDGYINVHANLPDVQCNTCKGSGEVEPKWVSVKQIVKDIEAGKVVSWKF